MPVRLLRDGILTSERIASLNWAEEVFYRRLMSVVDDYGRYFANPKLIRAACYPLQIDKVSDPDIEKWLTACVTAALVRVYSASDEKRYLEILDFGQQVRSKSKYPEPSDSTCKQLLSDAHPDEDVFGGEVELKPSSPPKAPPCKTQEIIDLFAKQCPSMIQPRLVPDSVKAMIADRWRQDAKHQSLEFWEKFFEYCESLDFLTGRAPPTRGEKPFRVGLEWIVKSGNFAKIINGNYANG